MSAGSRELDNIMRALGGWPRDCYPSSVQEAEIVLCRIKDKAAFDAWKAALLMVQSEALETEDTSALDALARLQGKVEGVIRENERRL